MMEFISNLFKPKPKLPERKPEDDLEVLARRNRIELRARREILMAKLGLPPGAGLPIAVPDLHLVNIPPLEKLLARIENLEKKGTQP